MDRLKMAKALNMPLGSSLELVQKKMSEIIECANELNPNAHWKIEDFSSQNYDALNRMADENPQKLKALNDALLININKSNMDRLKMARALSMPSNSSDEALLNKLSEIVEKAEQLNPNANWKIEDFLEKDPDALNKMAIENPSRFQALNDEYFSKAFEKSDLGKGYEEASKKELQKAKKDLMLLTKEEREEFKESYPEEYAKIMKS